MKPFLLFLTLIQTSLLKSWTDKIVYLVNNSGINELLISNNVIVQETTTIAVADKNSNCVNKYISPYVTRWFFQIMKIKFEQLFKYS